MQPATGSSGVFGRTGDGRKALAAIAAALLSAAATAPAAAAIKIATYTGTVDTAVDAAGEFGVPGADLVGETMVERFVYDTSLGIRATTASSDNVYGGTHYGVSDPLLSATVTIGGFTLTIDSSTYYGSAGIATPTVAGQESAIGEQAEAFYDSGIQSLTIFAQTLIDTYQSIPNNLETNFTYTTPDAFEGIEIIGVDDASRVETFDTVAYGSGTLSVTDGAPAPAAVPEPATWALLLAGFGGVGAVARRRRAVRA